MCTRPLVLSSAPEAREDALNINISLFFFILSTKKNLAPDDLTVPGYGEPAEVHHHLALLSVPQLDPAALVNIQLLHAELSL